MTADRTDDGNTGLRSRITRRSFLIGASAGLVVTLIVLVVAQAAIASQARARVQEIAASIDREIERWISERLLDVTTAAGWSPFASNLVQLREPGTDSALYRRQLNLLVDGIDPLGENFEEILVLDLAGPAHVLASTRRERIGDYLPEPLYYRFGQDGPFVSEVYAAIEPDADGRPRLTVSAPILGPDGVVGVLAGHVDLSTLDAILAARSERNVELDIYLVTSYGDFVTSQGFEREGLPRGPESFGIRQVTADVPREGVETYPNYAGESVVGAYRPLADRKLGLLVELPASWAYGPARRLALVTLLAGLLASLGIAVASNMLARDVAEPLEQLAAATGGVTAGDLSPELPDVSDAPAEVALLARRFDDMFERLRRSYGDLESQIEVATSALEDAESSRMLLQAIVDNSTSLIGVCTRDGVFRLANRRLSQALAPDRASLVGERILEVTPDPVARHAWTLMQQALAEDRVLETEFDADFQGTHFHFFAVVFPLHSAPGRDDEVGFIALDRTDRVRAEQTRMELEGQLQHAQKLESLGILAGGVAHDFNNLLQAILGHVTLLEDELPPDLVNEHVEPIGIAASRAAELTGQLLAYAGRKSLRRESVEVNLALRQMSELIAVTVPKSATFRQDLDPDAGAVEADPAQISQVLMNLLTNAADALPGGMGEVTLRTRAIELRGLRAPGRPSPAELPDGVYVEIVVSDTGVGMDEETLQRIFDPFFSTKETGRGLGLAAVTGIVQGSGGHLSVESVPGEGTTFTVLFPRVEVVVDEPAIMVAGADPLAGLPVLLADDEAGVRNFVTRALTRAGAEVVVVEDGRAALEAFHADPERWGLVLFDLTMPRMGGVEALLEIRKSRPGLPALLCSGYDAADSLAAIDDDPMVEFLQKPFRTGTLVRRISALLSRAGAPG